MKTLIVVPARYASKRFPGKPLAKICGISMLRRVSQGAKQASEIIDNCDYVVATDDKRILEHCEQHHLPCVMTSSNLKSGSDRALAGAIAYEKASPSPYSHIINLQGDVPFTPPKHVRQVYDTLQNGAEVATPYIQLTWEELDTLRANKIETPFSGTTLIANENDQAIWFSKNIIPAIRKEDMLKKASKLSPVKRHIGLYGFKRRALEAFIDTPESHYENLEGLEQLRILENGIKIECVSVERTNLSMSGVDTLEDLERAEALLTQHGDPYS